MKERIAMKGKIVTPRDLVQRFQRFARTHAGHQAITALGTLWGILAIGAGFILPIYGKQMEVTGTFDGAFALVSPLGWGIGFVITGMACVLSVNFRRSSAPYPLIALAVMISLMAFLISDTFINHEGSPLISWTFIVLAVAILVVASSVDEKAER